MQTSSQWPRRRNRRGVSLIEILVVLAILVVGILAIIRLFPSGFFSIESVGNTALADTIGSAALGAQAEDAASLPSAILANDLIASQYSSSDVSSIVPDFSQVLDMSRWIQDESITVPSPKSANTAFKSVYTVRYGPMGRYGVTSLANSLTINSTYWQDVTGTSIGTLDAPAVPQADLSDDQMPGQQRVLVDYANGKLAAPYAHTFGQTFTVLIVGNDGVVYTLDFLLPPSGSSATVTDPHQPNDPTKYLPDSQDHYNGGWFDPRQAMTDPTDNTKTYKYNTDAAPLIPPLPWKSVMLYRPFARVPNAGDDGMTFTSADPYQYTMASPDIMEGTDALANLGAIAFNPVAAGNMGVKPIKARISYFTTSWRVLHEDRDLIATNGTGGTVTRLTLKNLKKVGDPQSDNTIYAGLITGVTTVANQKDIIFLDLDTGQPLNTPVNDEDANGTVAANINVSYATGRVTFPSAVTARRVRIFYAGDQDWTVAVQKAPDVYTQDPPVATTDPAINAGHYAYGLDPNSNDPCLFFPRCDAGKTVEIDGLVAYDNSMPPKAYPCPNVTVAIGDVPIPLGGVGYVEVDLKDTIQSALGGATLGTNAGSPGTSPVTITAVRGLSARAVVAWTERGRWKVHVVDTILARPQ